MPEQSENIKDLTREELQLFINGSVLDIPEMRRDISKLENLKWLLRNILIRNSDKVSQKQYDALKKLSSEKSDYSSLIGEAKKPKF